MANAHEIFEQLLEQVVSGAASDLHLSPSHSPILRVNGDLVELDMSPLSEGDIWDWLNGVLPPERVQIFRDRGDADFSFQWGDARFRGSVYRERHRTTLALRHLQDVIPTFDQIGLPSAPRQWPFHQTGLVIVTGPTGSGKSTTIASMVNATNQADARHILTIEDPIEYILPPGKSTIRHREIGGDTTDFPRAIRAGLREDVDVMVIGEMRDAETIAAAITVAETGHMVFATLHTPSAAQAVDRIVDAFDASEQPLIRSRLSACLTGVVYQRLIKSTTGGRVAAFEVLVANDAVRNLIREGKTHHIPNAIITGAGVGMRTMDAAVQELADAGQISKDVASEFIRYNV